MRRRKRALDSLNDDIRDHIDRETQDNLARGLSPEEARRQALLTFGNVGLVEEDTRAVWVHLWFEQALQDIRYSLRTLRRNPGFAAAVIVTLALGIGANTALFSVADAVLLKPFPYPVPERLVLIDGAPFTFTKTSMGLSRRVVESPLVEAAGIFAAGAVNIGGDSRPERVAAAAVTHGFFAALGVQPTTGRVFTETETASAERVAVVSHALWTRRAGSIKAGDPIIVNGHTFTVLGIMPPRTGFPGRTDIWIPVGADPQITGNAFVPQTIARLAPGVSPAQAAAEIDRINEAQAAGREEPPRSHVVQLREMLTGHVQPLFAALSAAVLLVLLVACMNTASLLLARLSAREREMSMRRALGASRLRLARQLFCESGMLAAGAGLLAVPAAMLTLKGIRALLPATLHGAADVTIDGRAVAATALLCVASTMLFGLAPAWSLRRVIPGAVLRGGPGGAIDPFWRRFRSSLVVAELATALVLLAGAATIVRTVGHLLRVDIGVRGERALTMEMTLPFATYGSTDRVRVFQDRLETRVAAIPGAEAVGFTSLMPGSTESGVGLRIVVEGQPGPEGERRSASYLSASPGYFRAIGIDLIAGRTFTAADTQDAPATAVISESLAQRVGLTPAEAVGRRMQMGFDKRWATIVGVVRDVRMRGPEGPSSAQFYLPVAQAPPSGTTFLIVKVAGGDPLALAPILRTAVTEVDPELPLYNVQTFDQVRDGFVAERRFAMAVISAFGLLAAMLAGVGLYGVLTYLVQLRRREIGIRMALGASSGAVRWQVVRGGLLLAVTGALAGSAAAAAAMRLMTARVPGIEAADPPLLAGVALVTMVGAAAITWLPAHRATRVNPVDALRRDA